jgi:hypothetical protein
VKSAKTFIARNFHSKKERKEEEGEEEEEKGCCNKSLPLFNCQKVTADCLLLVFEYQRPNR